MILELSGCFSSKGVRVQILREAFSFSVLDLLGGISSSFVTEAPHAFVPT